MTQRPRGEGEFLFVSGRGEERNRRSAYQMGNAIFVPRAPISSRVWASGPPRRGRRELQLHRGTFFERRWQIFIQTSTFLCPTAAYFRVKFGLVGPVVEAAEHSSCVEALVLGLGVAKTTELELLVLQNLAL